MVTLRDFGFAQLLRREGLAEHVRSIRAEGFPEYRVWPEGEREIYSSIVYLEPFAGRNPGSFGYDMLSEPVRRAAMERARDNDEATLSGKVILVGDNELETNPGSLMFAPVYRMGAPRTTVAERRTALVGWIFSPCRTADVMKGVLPNHGVPEHRRLHLEIFDGTEPNPATLLYDSISNCDRQGSPGTPLKLQMTADSSGRPWLLSFADDSSQGFGADYSKAWLVLTGGLANSFLIGGLVLALAGIRAHGRQLALRLTTDLRRTKERWKFALEGSRDGVWDWNIQTGKTFLSPRFKAMFGYAEDDIGSDVEEWNCRVHPDDFPRVLAEIQAHLDGKSAYYFSEHRFLCKDGTWAWVQDRGKVVWRNPDGQAVRMSGTYSDRELALAAGANGYVSKPVVYRILFEEIRRLTGVCYEYDPLPAVPSPVAADSRLAPASLVCLHSTQRQQLKHALCRGDTRAMRDALDAIARDHPQLADALRALVDAYEYDRLAGLLDAAPPEVPHSCDAWG